MKATTKKVRIIKCGDDIAEIRKEGKGDDYSVYFRNADSSVRGTYANIMDEMKAYADSCKNEK